MSPRPQLGVGKPGVVSFAHSLPMVTARCRFRGLDGVTRQVSAQGTGVGRTEKAVILSGEKAARAALEAKLSVMSQGSDELNSETRLSTLAELWYTSKLGEGLKYRTLERSRSVLDTHVIPGVGGLRIREASTAKLEVYVRKIAAERGAATAVIVRSVLSGMFSEAQRFDAVVVNPIAATRVPKRTKGEIRAMSFSEFEGMRAHAVEALKPLTKEERLARANGDVRRMGGANRAQTPLDVIDFLIATGARASEVLGLCWGDVHLDGDVPFVRIHQQVIREKGRGLVLAPTKERDIRLLALPAFAVDMLSRRALLPTNQDGAVFTNVRGNLIDPSNMRSVWRRLFKGTEWEWVTQKTLRKTVATVIDMELGSELAAKQLGHTSDSMTKKHYIAPSKLPQDQRSALEQFGT